MNNKYPTAIVTGSTAGIGKAIAFALATRGYSVIITGRREKEKVASMLDEIDELAKRKNSCVYIRGDIAEKSVRDSIISCVENDFSSLDVLVNNAGITTAGRKDILEINEEEALYLLRVNLVSPLLLTSSLAPYLQKSEERSYIINISSISAYAVSNNRADYCISKAGMSMMTQQFAARLAESNIGVFEIRPGIIETGMTAGVKAKYDKLIAEGLLPIARWGQPEDVAKAVTAIVEGAFPYSTGEIINVDGGFHIRRL